MQPHTQSSYRHQDVKITFFDDIHGNEVGEYGALVRMSIIVITTQRTMKQALKIFI